MSENKSAASTNDDMESSTEAVAERAAVLQKVLSELLPLRSDDRRKVLETLSTFFGLEMVSSKLSDVQAIPVSSARTFQFSEQAEAPSVKAFVAEKDPRTDVERVACLAYYLSRFRGTPHLKTKDVSTLNTESANRRFSNAAVAVENATKAGYLVSSVKGSKQISAFGERYVEALPDREAARAVLEQSRSRRGGVGMSKKS